MRVTNPAHPDHLHVQLQEAVERVAAQRGFDASTWLEEKSSMLNQYMALHGLRSTVVAVSGGIDSAVVLGIAAYAKAQSGSPIERIVPLLAPVHSSGATGQDEAVARGRAVCTTFDVNAHVIDLTDVHAQIKQVVDGAVGIEGGDWASGQLVAYARTPAFYYTTSLLTQEGLGAILLGTTNRDEGAYLGYVGKASDGMVDVQLIADLHKDEVRAVAVVLGMPDSVVNAVPTGDMYDGRDDEEVFGATYPFVKLYLNYLCWDPSRKSEFLDSLTTGACAQFDEMAEHLEKLHRYNGHKYLSRSPAVHLNILTSAVPGGWDR